MNISTKRSEIVRNYINAYNNFDIEGMLSDLHPDVLFENVSNGETNMTLKGIEAFKQQAEQAKHIFSSRQQDISNMVLGNDSIEVTIHYQGTLAIDFPNGLKKGETLEVDGKSIFKFSGDKIIQLTDIS